MIDYFSLAVSHGLLALALWRLLARDDLDHEDADIADRPASDRSTAQRPPRA